MTISTHVLDAALGRPASGLPIRLDGPAGSPAVEAVTGPDGRAGGLAHGPLEPGDYQLHFDTAAYFAATGRESFYPKVIVTFSVTDAEQHYHVPLLLSPFAYSTYRGS